MNRGFFLGILLVVCNLNSVAQEKKLPLHAVLLSLEQRYDVTFTFIDKNIEGIFIFPPPHDLNIEAVLRYLEERTGLQYRQLDGRFITISLKQSQEKSICGVLVDALTGEPIPGATIQVAGAFAVSDEEGMFRLPEASETDTIFIRHLGYEMVIVPTAGFFAKPCEKVYLKQIVTTLSEVVVTNYITEGISKKVDGSFAIYNENLGILPGLTEPDVLQTLQALPGIQSINETVSDINVRGGTNDQNLVLWNGIRMYQSGHFFGLISAFNPYLTKEVNLIKNGTSAFLGEGVSSTIDIHTSDELVEEFSGGGGVNLINADAFVKFPISHKTSVELAGRRSIADVIKTATYRQYFERAFSNTDVVNASNDEVFGSNESFYFYDVSTKVVSHINEKDRLIVNFLGIDNKIEYEESAIIDSQREYKTSSLTQRSLASGIAYNRSWNNRLKTFAQISLSSYRLGAVNFDVLNAQRLIQENEMLDIAFKLHGNINLSKKLSIFTGYQVAEVGASNLEDINKPLFRRYIKEVIQTHSIFAEGTYTSTPGNTRVRLGLRSNYFGKFREVNLEPRMAISHSISPHFSVEVLGEIKSQTTTQIIDFQKDFLGVEKRRWVLVNDNDIPIIRSKQASLGLQYNKKGLLVSIDGYYKHVDGIISSSQGFQNQYQFVRSTGEYDAVGFDFIVNKKLNKLNAWLSYSYSQNTFSFKAFTPPEFPNNLDIRHTVTYGVSYQAERFEVSLGANGHTGKPFTEPDSALVGNNNISYGPPNSSRLDDYIRIDGSIKYNFHMSTAVKAEVGGGVWNVFNRENIVNTYFLPGDGSAKEIDQKSLGITPNVFFRVSF